MSSDLAKDLERERKQLETALNEELLATLRRAWLPNTIAWVLVAVGGFLLNLLLLILLTGG